MKKKLFLVVIFNILVILSCNKTSKADKFVPVKETVYPLIITNGSSVLRFEEVPKRIVSCSLISDEILLSLVEPTNILALSPLSINPSYSMVAEKAKGKNIVKANAEDVSALMPDIVFTAPFVNRDFLNAIGKSISNVCVLNNFESISDIESTISLMGIILNRNKEASSLIENMRNSLSSVSNRLKGVEKKRVIMLSSYGYTAGKNTSFDTVCTHASAINIASVIGIKSYAEVPFENLLAFASQIDTVIISEENPQNTISFLKTHKIYSQIPAISEGKIINIKPALLSSVSQNIVVAVETMAKELYQARF